MWRVGNERDEDVCFDALLELVVDGAQAEVVLEVLEGRLDLGQLDVELPQVGRVLPTQIGAQQVVSLALAHFSELLAIELEAERGALRSKLDID